MGHHLQRGWICIFIICLFISWGIRAFRCKMVVLLTSIAPHTVMISTYPGVGSRPGFFSSPTISISTSTSSIIILISIPTLTSISKSPMGVLSCSLVLYYLIYCNLGNYHSYHLTYGYSIPSASRSISINWSIIVSIVVISSITTMIPSSTIGSISRCKILLTCVLVSGPNPGISLVYIGAVSYP